MRSGASLISREFSANFIQNCTQESGGFGGEHEEYQQFGCVRYANPFELQWGIVVNVGNNRPRRTHQLLSLIARRRALVTLNSDHFLLWR